MRSMPTAKIATDVTVIEGSPARNATASPTIEQATAPTIRDAIGVNSDSFSAEIGREFEFALSNAAYPAEATVIEMELGSATNVPRENFSLS